MRVLSVALPCPALASSAASSLGRRRCNSAPALAVIGSGGAGAFAMRCRDRPGLPEIGTPGSFSSRLTGAVSNAPILVRREQPPLRAPSFDTAATGGGAWTPALHTRPGSRA